MIVKAEIVRTARHQTLLGKGLTLFGHTDFPFFGTDIPEPSGPESDQAGNSERTLGEAGNLALDWVRLTKRIKSSRQEFKS